MYSFFEHLKNLRKVAVVMLLVFSTFYLLLLFLNQNDNQEIANNVDKFNQSEIVFKSDNNIQDIAEIKENIEKVKEKEEIVSENKENQTISKEVTTEENIKLDIKEEIIENSYQPLETTDKLNKLGTIEIPIIDLNLAIFEGKPFVNTKNKTDIMLYGAVTNKQNQVMGKGNYILASHIISNSDLLFTNINRLEKGDVIVLKDSDYTYKYTVYNNFIVSNDETWILNDIKDYSVLTLYTCYDDNTKLPENRVVIRAVLTDIS
ncbi:MULTISPECIES: class A sortase [Enterococcus]|uniref:class A sortase n=1 Tax=Enterococcus TaxID=1350 RepID=UPI00033005BF|nr:MULTISPECIES: class A sortase [Enterococcus]EOL67939.1 sortase [Enterococcus faecium EnGen0305]EOM40910.1 sortase [Enterococcus faecium EnGen0173]MDT2142831.1 sortase [Enterococcus faecalis]